MADYRSPLSPQPWDPLPWMRKLRLGSPPYKLLSGLSRAWKIWLDCKITGKGGWNKNSKRGQWGYQVLHQMVMHLSTSPPPMVGWHEV